ncbi:MAG TPA: glycosyltransferase family 9 protein [Verrucomicrobiae bacterium]|jgi:lipopolysaccharide heptosyltransferase II|nr:glycosyltransferase family 9 protein [Verrucomicrobiae bacterium]
MNFSPKKILIVLHGSIGDVTRAIPLANLLRRGFPHALIAWSIEPAALPLIEHHPAIDEIIVFDRADWRRSLLPFLRRIRNGHFDLVLDLQRHLKSGIISRWSGTPHRVGFNRRDAKELNWLFNNHEIPPATQHESKLNHYLRFLDFLGVSTSPLVWDIPLSPAETGRVEKLARETGGPFVAYCVGGRWESKRWFADEAAKSAAQIYQRYGLAAAALGGDEDRPFAAQMQRLGTTPMANLTGRTSLREAIGILSRAELSVGPDSGLMHLSAAVGTPVISLWGPTDPKRTGPHGFEDLIVQGSAPCVPCYVRECPIGRICMRSITSEQILSHVDAALNRRDFGRGAAN